MTEVSTACELVASARFMWTLHTANPDHWVPVSTVASFKRMREFSSQGEDWLVSSLRTISDALEVDEEGKNVRRRTEVTEPKGQFERSVYAVRAIYIPPHDSVSLNYAYVVERLRRGGIWLAGAA